MAVYIRHKSKAEKGDTLTLRISTKDKFALDLLATIQRKSLSSIVMEAIQKPLRDGLTMEIKGGRGKSPIYIPDVAYDPLIPDRLVKLAMVAPDLLTEREKVVWKIVQEDSVFWTDNTPTLSKIRANWDSIQTETDKLLDSYSK